MAPRIHDGTRRAATLFVRTYLTVDPRSLALGRVVLALVLMVNLGRRVRWLRDFYSNEGLIPNHTVLWQAPRERLFSVFFMASHAEEAALLFVVAFLCFFFFAIGWRTRLFHLLSLVMTVSLHTRIGLVENGGAIALDLLLVWTAFLPMGRCFSVDALRVHRRVRVRPRLGAAAEDPTPESRVRPATEPVVSLAVLAVLLQLAVIYWFNFAHKTGVTWRTGTAVHYVLRQERIVTVLGILARRMPFAITKGLTYGTLAIEACAPFLLLTPLFTRHARRLAILLLTGLHASIALLANLGIFSAAMIAYFPLLIDSRAWDWLARRSTPANREAVEPTGRVAGASTLSLLREHGVAFVLVVLASDVTVANASVPAALRWTSRPPWIASALSYVHVYEGWGMFAPESPVYDEMVVVDARTRDGRHVDPLNEIGSRVHALPVDDIPERLGHDSLFCDYTLRIPGSNAYHRALLEWILRYPERTGDPLDAIESFDAIKLEHTPPAPGQSQSTEIRRTTFLKWPEAPSP